MSKNKQVHNKNKSSLLVRKSTSFEGPIPPPQVLEGYNKICPGAADRIIKMAEDQAKHRHGLENKVIHSDSDRAIRGQIFSFCLAVLVIIFGFILLLVKNEIVLAIVVTVAPCVLFATTYLFGKAKKKKELDEERNRRLN